MKKKSLFPYFCRLQIIDLILVFLLSVLSVLLSRSSSKIPNTITKILPPIANINSIILPIILSVVPVICALTILVFQIYYNRYSIKELKDYIKWNIGFLLIISFTLIIGCLLNWLTNYNFLLLNILIFSLTLYLCIRLLHFLLNYSKLSFLYHVRNIQKRNKLEIRKLTLTGKDLKILFSDIDLYLFESIEKRENIYISSVLELKQEIFLTYLENRDKYILSKKEKEVVM